MQIRNSGILEVQETGENRGLSARSIFCALRDLDSENQIIDSGEYFYADMQDWLSWLWIYNSEIMKVQESREN